MYKFIYYFFFKLSEKSSNDPKFQGAILTGLVVLIHLVLSFCIIKLFVTIPPLVFSEKYYFNKLFLTPFVLLWLYLFYLYFRKKHKWIEKLYFNKKILLLKNWIIVFSLFLIPIIFIILLTKIR
jgi:hypothetical protein